MPLLDIKVSKKIDIHCSLEQSTATLVEQYATFLKVPADEVINASLEHVFSKDKEFQQYLEKHPQAPEFSSLRVQLNGSKPGRKAGSSSGQLL
jgi:hypothetical protein